MLLEGASLLELLVPLGSSDVLVYWRELEGLFRTRCDVLM